MISALGCSGTEDAPAATGENQFDEATADTGRWGGDDGDASESVMPTHWTLSGTIVISDHELDTDMSSLRATVEDVDRVVLCWEGAALADAVRAEANPDPDVDIWWDVGLVVADDSGCSATGIDSPFPASLGLGLGPLHEEIEAVLGSELGGEPPEDQQVRSVFAALGEQGPVWVFGLATNDVSVDAGSLDGELADSAVSDGQWKFRAIYPFPYGE